MGVGVGGFPVNMYPAAEAAPPTRGFRPTVSAAAESHEQSHLQAANLPVRERGRGSSRPSSRPAGKDGRPYGELRTCGRATHRFCDLPCCKRRGGLEGRRACRLNGLEGRKGIQSHTRKQRERHVGVHLSNRDHHGGPQACRPVGWIADTVDKVIAREVIEGQQKVKMGIGIEIGTGIGVRVVIE